VGERARGQQAWGEVSAKGGGGVLKRIGTPNEFIGKCFLTKSGCHEFRKANIVGGYMMGVDVSRGKTQSERERRAARDVGFRRLTGFGPPRVKELQGVCGSRPSTRGSALSSPGMRERQYGNFGKPIEPANLGWRSHQRRPKRGFLGLGVRVSGQRALGQGVEGSRVPSGQASGARGYGHWGIQPARLDLAGCGGE
jgi:hypothetical protein